MFVCKNARKINVIGSFLWGFQIASDGAPNDGNVAVTSLAPVGWSQATQSAINTLAREARGTRTQRGWSVQGEGCCCRPLALREGFSAFDGLCTVLVENPEADVVMDQIVFFPRNRPVDPATFDLATPPGWMATYWGGGTAAPPLPYQDVADPFEMFEAGLVYINTDHNPGPDTYPFEFLLTGHESFFDVYVHMLPDNVWVPYVIRTQQLLGDMDGNGVIDEEDLPIWTLAWEDPEMYVMTYGLDPLFAGDLDHNDSLTVWDLILLGEIVTAERETDATDLALECQSHDDCNDFDPCTHDQCADDAQCTNTPAPYEYGDVDHNGAKNVFDIFCILDLIAGDPPASPNCTLANADIHPCDANGVINVFDALAILEAIAGPDPCCGE